MFKSVRSYYVKIRFVEKITLKRVERRENTQTTRSRVRNNRRVRAVISKALIKYSIWLFGGLPQRRTANGPKAELSEMTARKKKKNQIKTVRLTRVAGSVVLPAKVRRCWWSGTGPRRGPDGVPPGEIKNNRAGSRTIITTALSTVRSRLHIIAVQTCLPRARVK